MQLIAEYVVIFAFLLLFAYLVPAGALHWIVSGAPERRIQMRRARPQDVRREVRHSLQSLLLFALFSLGLGTYREPEPQAGEEIGEGRPTVAAAG